MMEKRSLVEVGLKALLIKTSSLGDLLQVYPVVDYLKQLGYEIDWVVEYGGAGLVKNHPDIRRAIVVSTKAWRKSPLSKTTWRAFSSFKKELQETDYDLLIDLQGNTKSALFTYLAHAKVKVGFGTKSAPEWPNTLVTSRQFDPPTEQNRREDYLYIVKSYFHDHSPFEPNSIKLLVDKEANHTLSDKNNVIVAPGSAWPSKQLPLETLAQFLQKIKEQYDCHFHFIWGSPAEFEKAKELAAKTGGSVVDRLTLPQLQQLMSRVDLVISMDSLPLHLAGTTSTPTISLFGPSSANTYRPLGAQHHSYQGLCPYQVRFEKRCPHLRTCKKAPCLGSAQVSPLLDHFRPLLDQLFAK